MSEKPLRIELLGQVRLIDGEAAPMILPSGRRCALLSYLILHRDAAVPRGRLARLFWPDSKEGQARTNLRRELHHLRAEIPHADELLTIRRPTLQWSSNGRARVDIEEFEQLRRDAAEARAGGEVDAELCALERAAALYRGDLLPSVDGDWVERERARLRAALLSVLSRLWEAHEASGDPGAALAHAEGVIRLEPLDEGAYRALMRLHLRSGDRAAAVHAYHRLSGVLRRELDLGPRESTRQLYQALLTAPGAVGMPVTADARESVPLVGREGALASLGESWLRACSQGSGTVVVYGEAGIGKTRLIEEFARRVRHQAATVAHARAYAAEGAVSYGLVLEWLRTPAIAAGLTELPGVWRTQLAPLVPELDVARAERRHLPDTLPAAWHRRRLLEAIVHGLLAAARPLLLLADDVQWADADSLEALRLLGRLAKRAPVLLVATARAEEISGNGHLGELLGSLRYGERVGELELGRLSPENTALLAREVAGDRLAPDRLETIYRLSEGVPLFVVEALRTPGDDDAKGERAGTSDGVRAAFSPRVRAVLASRLRQLTPDARALAELAATVGRAFSFEVLERASDRTEEELVRSLDELWRRRIVREQAAGAYDFSHDALRDAAYRGIEPGRRLLLHRRVARALDHPHARAPGLPSARLAHHYELGGEVDHAVEAYARAAHEAAAVYSHAEAVRRLDRAHALLAAMPSTPDRDRRELQLQLAKVVPLRSLGGHAAPALDAAMRRARALSERLGDRAGLFQALINQQTTRFVSGRVSEALELSEPLQTLTREVPEWRAEVEHTKGGTLLNAGDLEGAIAHFQRSARRYDTDAGAAPLSRAGVDLAAFTAAWQAQALWLYGMTERALASSARAVRRAKDLRHPYSEVVAHAYAAVLHHMRRDRTACARHADAARDLCERYGFAYYVHWGTMLGAWARPGRDREVRVARVREAIAAVDGEGAATRKPFYLSLLAMVLVDAGQRAAARATLAVAAELAEASDEAWWRPEIARLRAVSEPDPESALVGLREALSGAIAMKARPLAARAAASLALALRAAGRTEEARRALDRALDVSPHRGRDRARAERLAARLAG